MRILYIFTSPSPHDTSVQNKVKTQIEQLNFDDIVCHGIFIGTFDFEERINKYISYTKIENCDWKYFKLIGQNKYLNSCINKLLKTKYFEYDLIYIRYFGASRFFYKIVKKYGNKIITEHQSIEILEIKCLQKENPFGLKPSKFLSWIQYYAYPMFMERYYGVKIAKKLLAAVCVTNEIAKYKVKMGFKDTIVVSNGISVSKFKLRNATILHDKLKLIFLKGTSTLAPWNGFDRLVRSIDYYNLTKRNKLEIELIVCGHKFEKEIPLRDYIKHQGYLSKSEIDALMNNVNLGVSAMESYKEGVVEACRLKDREYAARGLPFIYANEDFDFRDATWFAHKLPNSGDIIDFNEVISFAEKIQSIPEHPMKIRQYAIENIDYSVKMEILAKELKKRI